MEQRGFSEVELRAMVADATEVLPARHPGRWRLSTHLGPARWVVVVEPDPDDQIVYVITAFPQGRNR